MSLGYISLTDPGVADRILADLAQDLAARTAGVVAMVQADRPGRACEMTLALLPDGPRTTLSLPLAPQDEACRLDPGALENAVAWVARRLEMAPRTRLLILNKFGKQEVAGRGCRPLIGQALDQGAAVLISVPPETRAAFEAFADGLAEEVPATPAGLAGWLERHLPDLHTRA